MLGPLTMSTSQYCRAKDSF